ncbi:hypothetical protein PsW64_02409 [Pseudovibrio sp. W64]|uniref:hypothetical protein n=1 Tax=Pseudovibrio sp. W64 TaxID=1735583 RepID=UPI0007B2FE16|nr:hypothetical protein [Pseudovibrio sp. W64]KZK81819.1 hypothetical protein PsW64_02409 [Pseudovibrio sp. W64]
MSQSKTKKHMALGVVTGLIMMATAGTGMANSTSGVLVFDSICEDRLPAGIFELAWLSRTRGKQNIYHMDTEGKVSALTRDAPTSDKIEDLRVTEHGSCKSVGPMSSEEFANNLTASFDPDKLSTVDLATCNGGSLNIDSPARVLSRKLGKQARVMGWNELVSLTGNGSYELAEQQFGTATSNVHDKWEQAQTEIDKKIISSWGSFSKAKYTQTKCKAALKEAIENPDESDFMSFIRGTVNYYTTAKAMGEKYHFLLGSFFELQPGRTVCGSVVLNITGEECVSAR